ncbi:WxcM-like domain-containing protein [Pseudomonas sp. WS 5406]|uniref:sugar 3,4-ketoisomerase n=1 Tax=Pseudomonas sp. WS 5406 TaxID=2717498 RepID=UPI001475730A|nr:FdtA/QdtA family cupin domain-containing protein [Pseudomonas sp. WS 5406]NMX27115.1 WxcM-like domain-containing protein [Pseudomonas sp. WS 5406]
MPLVKFIELPRAADGDGVQVEVGPNSGIPFDVARTYYIFGTKAGVERGFHAHIALQQMAICVVGSCRMRLDNGVEKDDVFIESSSQGLLIEPMVWHEMYDFSPDCVLMVLASDVYDESDYIRDYGRFTAIVKEGATN